MINLSDNTNLWGTPPTAVRALARPSRAVFRDYPPAFSPKLVEILASYAGVSAECVVTGCGSDDLLDAAIRANATPGELIAVLDPTFDMVRVFARASRLRLATVPLTPACDVDPDQVLALRASLTYLCSPNNPTGGALSPEGIARIVRESSGIVIVDEAYAEYAGGTSCLDLLRGRGRPAGTPAGAAGRPG